MLSIWNCLKFVMKGRLKGGYLDFSHLTELEYIYITEIYIKKPYKSSRIKNHKITTKKFWFFLIGFPLKVSKPLKLFLDLAPEIKKKKVL